MGAGRRIVAEHQVGLRTNSGFTIAMRSLHWLARTCGDNMIEVSGYQSESESETEITVTKKPKKTKATYITLVQGNKLLMFKGYSYSKNSKIRNGGYRYTCSRTLSEACKAYAHVSADDIVIKHTEHNHEPAKYIKVNNGRYIRINKN
ncbi:hypothetical protein B5X24_HaOG207893 [Helicoverpa armigera]|uniref:FLYWCH-type domain-containing protein n=1 Tax=Helicoverpa armigera TaxID=29058 RepID=A0A2W1BNH1_HELAM|nr:hypothetical protein B5X24_HaOG207893 [Helicoverpa armigera]